ncbi:MAG: fibro-slime domain-containing protein [Phycisphaerales bacterium]|jgi:fibro-slime domain-containing protein
MRTGNSKRASWVKAAAIGGLMAGAGTANAQADQVLIHGTVYDFHGDHPDFGLGVGSGFEVSGLVDTVLGVDGKPTFMSSGTGLNAQALDGDGMPIAPHLYSAFAGGGPLVLENSQTQSGNSTLDTYDPNAGYDPSTAVEITEPVPPSGGIDNITPPPFDGSVVKVTNMIYKNEKTGFSISGTHHCDNFSMKNSIMNVVGDVVIRVDNSFEILTSSGINIPAGASLTFWIGGSFEIRNHCTDINVSSGDHTRLVFNNFGTTDMYIENNSDTMATINAPNATVRCENSSNFYGAISAAGLDLSNSCGVHLAGEMAAPSACYAQGDTQNASGSSSAGQIAGPSSFNQWFGSVPGVNDFGQLQLFMSDTGAGTYEMSTSEWDPINGELYGNEGDSGNRGFTFAGESQFENADCADLFFEVETAMDCWVFIDDGLVIDLGGNTGMSSQRIQTDRLSLTPGVHKLRVFIAQRQGGSEGLRITTTLGLTQPRGAVYQMSAHHD